MVFSRKQKKINDVVFTYDIKNGKLALVHQSLVTPPRLGVKPAVKDITVSERIRFAKSGRVIKGISRRFWLMPTSQSARTRVGLKFFMWCDSKDSIESLDLSRLEKELFREARTKARSLVDTRVVTSEEKDPVPL